MKKVISIFLLCALILSCFLGCSTPNAPVDENLPDEEGNSTPDDTTQEEIPDNVVNPLPDDDTDEKDPGNEGDSTPDDTDEKDPGNEGDSTPDDTDEKNPGSGSNVRQHYHTGDERGDTQSLIDAEKLEKIFDQIRADAETNAKLEFWVTREQLYYELKNSGEYDNCRWYEPCFVIVVICSYEDAVNEEWYQQCTATDTESLNKAFYDEYGGNISHGEYHNIAISSGMLFFYSSSDASHVESFVSDYDALKALLELSCVKKINIEYQFPGPSCYFCE